MNPDDIQQHSPTMSDDVRPSPTLSDDVRPSPTMSATRSEAHTLTTREVMKIFEEAGIPRAQRSIERYCQNGDLDCQPDAIEKRQYITRESVDTLIGQLKEIAARHPPKASTDIELPRGATGDDRPRQPATPAERDGVKHGIPEKQGEKQQAGEYEAQLAAQEARIKELENEKFLMEIDKRAKDQVISMMREQMTQELKAFTHEITRQSRRVGQLETQMRQLKAPDDDNENPDDDMERNVATPIDAEFREAPFAAQHEPGTE